MTLSANGQQQQFTATVAGTSNTAVTWSMSPSIGTLTTNGLYTAPFPGTIITTTQTVTITATSQADTTKSATATVTINPATSTGTAAFVHLDTTTQGNWHGVYGADGYNVINATVAYPSYVTVTPSGNKLCHLGEFDYRCAGAVHVRNQHEPDCSHLVQHYFLPGRYGVQRGAAEPGGVLLPRLGHFGSI